MRNYPSDLTDARGAACAAVSLIDNHSLVLISGFSFRVPVRHYQSFRSYPSVVFVWRCFCTGRGLLFQVCESTVSSRLRVRILLPFSEL